MPPCCIRPRWVTMKIRAKRILGMIFSQSYAKFQHISSRFEQLRAVEVNPVKIVKNSTSVFIIIFDLFLQYGSQLLHIEANALKFCRWVDRCPRYIQFQFGPLTLIFKASIFMQFVKNASKFCNKASSNFWMTFQKWGCKLKFGAMRWCLCNDSIL